MRLSSVNRHTCRGFLCVKEISALEKHMSKMHATSRTVTFPFREREQYIHCAAAMSMDRTAAGSEIKKRAEGEDSFIIHSVF